MKENTKSLVLIGAGHTHVLVMLRLKNDLPKNTRLTVIDPKTHAVYSGMLPGFIAGHYSRSELDIDVLKLSEQLGAKFVNAAVVSADPDEKRITLNTGEIIKYDVASIDVGITSNMPALEGFAEHGVPAKPLAKLSTTWDTFRQSCSAPKVAVIGGGVAGTELAMAMAYGLRRQNKPCSVTVFDRSNILSGVSARTRNRIMRSFQEFGISVSERIEIAKVTENGLRLANGEEVPANLVVGAAGAMPHPWLRDTGLKLENGYLNVNSCLQTSDPSIFAAGDCAHFQADPLPKAGVYAVRKAPVLGDNLIASLISGELREYKPQTDFLKLISLGDKSAIAQKYGMSLSGRWAWALKDRIDRNFMSKFL